MKQTKFVFQCKSETTRLQIKATKSKQHLRLCCRCFAANASYSWSLYTNTAVRILGPLSRISFPVWEGTCVGTTQTVFISVGLLKADVPAYKSIGFDEGTVVI
jgi:hypothetical protein